MAFLLRSMSRYNGTDKEATQGFGPRSTHLDFSPVQKWRRAQARRFFLCEAARQLGAGSSPFNLTEVMEAKDINVGVRRADTWPLPRVNFAMQSASLIAQASLGAGSQMHFPLHGSNGFLVQVARSPTVVSQGSRNQP